MALSVDDISKFGSEPKRWGVRASVQSWMYVVSY